MKFILIYFSGTGNTELITEKLAEDLQSAGNSVEKIRIEELKHGAPQITEDCILGIGFPVYKLTYPEIFDRLAPLLKPGDGRRLPFFAYSTYCRFSACSLHKAALLMEGIGYDPIGLQSFKCPSNGIASLKDQQSNEYKTVMYFENGIRSRITDFAGTITGNAGGYFETSGSTRFTAAHRGKPIDNIRINTAGKIEKARYPRLSIDEGKCRKCGLCANKCPEGNFIQEKNTVEVVDPYECLHCLRCLHLCPARAITFGPLVEGPGRYTKNIKERLFTEAEERNGKEPGTMPVRLKWAWGNIRYWIKSEISRKIKVRTII